MHHALYVHVVWTTRDRARLIDAGVAQFVWRYCNHVGREMRARILAGGFVQTHVHLIVRLHPTTAIPQLLQRLKGGSSVLAVRQGYCARARPLRWAKGYSVHSVSKRALPQAIEYVRNQARHHPDEAIPGWPPDRGVAAG